MVPQVSYCITQFQKQMVTVTNALLILCLIKEGRLQIAVLGQELHSATATS